MIPRKQDIAERFARSISTYETAGVVQREISEQLISLIEPIECGTVLEIGPPRRAAQRLPIYLQ